MAAGEAPVYIVGWGPVADLGCDKGAIVAANVVVGVGVGVGDSVVAFAAARDDMPGSCGSDADVEAESGREMGSRIGGGRI